jgi:hypothetical protein
MEMRIRKIIILNNNDDNMMFLIINYIKLQYVGIWCFRFTKGIKTLSVGVHTMAAKSR